jgi:hypothetical protein
MCGVVKEPSHIFNLCVEVSSMASVGVFIDFRSICKTVRDVTLLSVEPDSSPNFERYKILLPKFIS